MQFLCGMPARRNEASQTVFDQQFARGVRRYQPESRRFSPSSTLEHMHFNKAAKSAPHRANEIAEFYEDRADLKRAVKYLKMRLKDKSCAHDPAALEQLGQAFEDQAAQLNQPQSRAHARLQANAKHVRSQAAALRRPAPSTNQQAMPSGPPPLPHEVSPLARR